MDFAAAGLGLQYGTVRLVRSHPSWQAIGRDLARETEQSLGGLAATVEHVGSTSVPGLIAKPVIDLAVGLRPEVDVDELTGAMKRRGWIYRGDGGADGGLIFVMEDAPGNRVAHAHGVVFGDEQWRRYVEFRDLLRRDERARQDYTATKVHLAELHRDAAAAYMTGKTATVQDLLANVDAAAAVEVWRAANEARGLAPTPQRLARVREKLADPQAVVVVARRDGEVVGMLQAEPGRADGGAGEVVQGLGHVSMVFVHPDRWGQGVGAELMAEIAAVASDRGWQRLSLWTRASNDRARRLYEADGYRLTGDELELGPNDLILRYQRLV